MKREWKDREFFDPGRAVGSFTNKITGLDKNPESRLGLILDDLIALAMICALLSPFVFIAWSFVFASGEAVAPK